MSEQFTFFWSGPFSQWFHCDFEVNGMLYNCAEQYMMAEKARLFNDTIIEKAIMGSLHPRDQKALGRKVVGFDKTIWDVNAKQIVFEGNWAKFTQNRGLGKELLGTEDTTLVEASPQDTIWGIGLSEDDPRCQSRETWQGKNWLGEVLTRVRESIAKKYDQELRESLGLDYK